MLSACLNCSKGTRGWAQPTADGIWGAQGGLSPPCNKLWWVQQMKGEGRHATHSRSAQS